MTKDDQLYAVIWLVRPVFRALVAAADDRLSGNGLGVPERGVLECLSVIGPLTVPSLARTIGVPRQFEQRTCNGLLASGLAERREPGARSVRPDRADASGRAGLLCPAGARDRRQQASGWRAQHYGPRRRDPRSSGHA